VKVEPRGIDAFLRAPPDRIAAILLYGPDGGLVQERLASLAKAAGADPADAFGAVDLAAATLRTDPARLADEALALSLGGGRRVVTVRDAGEEVTPALAGLLELLGDGASGLVLIAAGDLAARSGLRKLVEGADRAAALPCYADDGASLERLAAEMLRADGIAVDREALGEISARLGGDRALARREIEKLALYVGAGNKADIDAVRTVLGDVAEASLDEAMLATADGDYVSLSTALSRVRADGASAIGVIRMAQRQFQRLYAFAADVESGATPAQVVERARPPVFWKQRPRVQRHVARWTAPAAANALQRLTEAELHAKSNAADEWQVCERVLLVIAQAARGLRG